MGNLTKKEIKKLVKAARADIGDMIEVEAIKQIDSGNTVDFELKIEMGDGDPPSKELGAVTQCYWFCYTIGGNRYCFKYCF